MNILFIASEVVPLVKTGGLADVVSALGAYLKSQGHNVRTVIPYYGDLKDKDIEVETDLHTMCVNMGPGVEEWCSLRSTKGTGDVPVWLIDHDGFYGRKGLYHDDEFNDYYDNPKRYAFLSRAALQACIDTGFKPDVIHAHDWQSSLALAYQKVWFWDNPIIGQAASVLTIHNAMYQGNYGGENFQYFGFSEEHFSSDKFEQYGNVNMLKPGIHFADVVNTVSPTHAHEISLPYSEFGIAPYLNNKGENFRGILNGCDYDEWNPEIDKLIPSNFSVDDLSGKSICKAELQKTLGLSVRPEVPIIGIVGRLVNQKGYHLLTPILDRIMETMDVQFAFLGSGDKGLEEFLGSMPSKYPGKFGSWIGYSNEIAHQIEAGADLFLMPSIFEPCGLNQIYSLKYGTLPIVRSVGGLADTVHNYDPANGHGTGFKFWEASPDALLGTISWAVDTWYNHPDHFAKLRESAMKEDFSWEVAGENYVEFYQQAVSVRRRYNSQF
jgi:starch synthase